MHDRAVLEGPEIVARLPWGVQVMDSIKEYGERVNFLTELIIRKKEMDNAHEEMVYQRRRGGYAYKQAKATWERKKRRYDSLSRIQGK